MIKINNILINKFQIDFIEIREKENTVYIHLQGGTSFLFCRDDCIEQLWQNGINVR